MFKVFQGEEWFVIALETLLKICLQFLNVEQVWRYLLFLFAHQLRLLGAGLLCNIVKLVLGQAVNIDHIANVTSVGQATIDNLFQKLVYSSLCLLMLFCRMKYLSTFACSCSYVSMYPFSVPQPLT